VASSIGEQAADVTGRLRFEADSGGQLPVTGDWVAFDGARIQAVMPRSSELSRKQPGTESKPQVLAANVDVCFLVSALDSDFNPRRIERYLAMVRSAGATPVVVLNKSDLCVDWDGVYEALEGAAPGVPSVAVSAIAGSGVQELHRFVAKGQTAALLGSSGTGKSTLINCLLGRERQRTGEIRESDQRGRHTTTHRELVLLNEGWLLLDMPGLRELQPWDPAIRGTFAEVEDFAEQCRFGDCSHSGEPGCAVLAALRNGDLDPQRFENFRKLEREAAYLRRKVDEREADAEKRRWKAIHRQMRHIAKKRT
jgi:ribosome biogenesis GTPase